MLTVVCFQIAACSTALVQASQDTSVARDILKYAEYILTEEKNA